MNTCPQCGAPNPSDRSHCYECGGGLPGLAPPPRDPGQGDHPVFRLSGASLFGRAILVVAGSLLAFFGAVGALFSPMVFASPKTTVIDWLMALGIMLAFVVVGGWCVWKGVSLK